MKQQALLKVCKVESLSFASFAIKAGVDFLGIHVLEAADIGEHLELVNFTRANGARNVIVTKITAENELSRLMSVYQPFALQLHCKIDIVVLQFLRRRYPTLTLFAVYTDELAVEELLLARPFFDYVIYDTSYIGGTNQTNRYVNICSFDEELKARTLLAGGVSYRDLEGLSAFGAAGFDMQSFFRPDGVVSFNRLWSVCERMGKRQKRKISVSLTDVGLQDIGVATLDYFKQPLIEFHLDISKGDLYEDFTTKQMSIAEKMDFVRNLPVSVHLFVRRYEDILKRVDKLYQSYPHNITRILVQYQSSLPAELWKETGADLNCCRKIVPSVFYEGLPSFLDQNPDCSSLSIVVPKLASTAKVEAFVRFCNDQAGFFQMGELWLDRELSLAYITLLKQQLQVDFNIIVGKEVTFQHNSLNAIHEQLSK